MTKIDKVTIDGKPVRPNKTYRMGMLTHLPRGFYEGKPFQIMPSDAVDDGSVIKHYRDITSSAMLFGIIEQAREDQNKDVPNFVAPSDIQIEESTEFDKKIGKSLKSAQKQVDKMMKGQ